MSEKWIESDIALRWGRAVFGDNIILKAWIKLDDAYGAKINNEEFVEAIVSSCKTEQGDEIQWSSCSTLVFQLHNKNIIEFAVYPEELIGYAGVPSSINAPEEYKLELDNACKRISGHGK